MTDFDRLPKYVRCTIDNFIDDCIRRGLDIQTLSKSHIKQVAMIYLTMPMTHPPGLSEADMDEATSKYGPTIEDHHIGFQIRDIDKVPRAEFLVLIKERIDDLASGKSQLGDNLQSPPAN